MNLSFIAPVLKEDKPVVDLQKEAVDEASKKWLNGLILYVLGSTPTLDIMNAFVEKEWNLVAKPKILFHDVDGYFIAKFNSLDDRNTVVCSGPWYVGTEPIVMKPWYPDFRFQKDEFLEMIPLWVQFPNLPLNFWGADSLSRIGSVIGKPLYADKSTSKQSKITYARVLIDTDVTKPLPETVTVVDPSGQKLVQKVVFEWKPTLVANVSHPVNQKRKLDVEQKPVTLLGSSGKNAGGSNPDGALAQVNVPVVSHPEPEKLQITRMNQRKGGPQKYVRHKTTRPRVIRTNFGCCSTEIVGDNSLINLLFGSRAQP